MASDDHEHLPSTGRPRVQQYALWAAKASLCIVCWVSIWALLVLYGPPAVSVPSVPTHAPAIVAATFGMVFATGLATVLTIIISVGIGILVALGWHHNQNLGEQDGTDVADAVGDGE